MARSKHTRQSLAPDTKKQDGGAQVRKSYYGNSIPNNF